MTSANSAAAKMLRLPSYSSPQVVCCPGWMPPLALRDGDDDLATGVALLDVAHGFGGVGQRVGAVEDGGELSGLDELGEGEGILPFLLGQERAQLLPDDHVAHGRPAGGAPCPEHGAG